MHPFRKDADNSSSAKHRSMGFARGGDAEADRKSDEGMIRQAIAEHEKADHKGQPRTKIKFRAEGGATEGGMSKPRADRKGGKRHGAQVNVIVAPQTQPHPAMGAGMGMPPMMPPHPPGPPSPPPAPPAPPPPGMGGLPPGMMPPGGMGMMPPRPGGIPPRKYGGAVGRKRGGGVRRDDGGSVDRGVTVPPGKMSADTIPLDLREADKDIIANPNWRNGKRDSRELKRGGRKRGGGVSSMENKKPSAGIGIGGVGAGGGLGRIAKAKAAEDEDIGEN